MLVDEIQQSIGGRGPCQGRYGVDREIQSPLARCQRLSGWPLLAHVRGQSAVTELSQLAPSESDLNGCEIQPQQLGTVREIRPSRADDQVTQAREFAEQPPH